MIARHYIASRSAFPDGPTFCTEILMRLNRGETVHVVEPYRFQLVRNGNAFMARDQSGEVIGTYVSVREAFEGASAALGSLHGE